MPTIGISIPVPDPWGRELQDYRIALGDEAGRRIPTHITLMPPVELTEDQVSDVVVHLSQVALASRPFRVQLRSTGTFRPVSPVVFVNVVVGISSCEMLAARVRSGPLASPRTFPYHPHVTVAHGLDDGLLDRAFEELSGFEAGFEVGAMWMYLDDADRGWQPRSAFALGGAAEGPLSE